MFLFYRISSAAAPFGVPTEPITFSPTTSQYRASRVPEVSAPEGQLISEQQRRRRVTCPGNKVGLTDNVGVRGGHETTMERERQEGDGRALGGVGTSLNSDHGSSTL